MHYICICFSFICCTYKSTVISLKNTRNKCACRIWTQRIVYEGFVCVLIFDDVGNLDESDSKCWRIFLVSLVDATKLCSTTSQRDNCVNLQTTKSSPHIWFLCSHSFFSPASESRMNTAAVFCLEANYKLFTKLEDRLYAEKGVMGKSWGANDLPKSMTNQADWSYSMWASGSTQKKKKKHVKRACKRFRYCVFSFTESGFHINFSFIKFNLLLPVWLTQKK